MATSRAVKRSNAKRFAARIISTIAVGVKPPGPDLYVPQIWPDRLTVNVTRDAVHCSSASVASTTKHEPICTQHIDDWSGTKGEALRERRRGE